MTVDNYNIESFDMDNQESLSVESTLFETPGLRYVSNGGDMTQGTPNAAGLDLKVHTISDKFIGTGIFAAIPTGWVGLVVPRSSLGLKGFRLKNTLGIIDSDYRGEIKLSYEGYTPDVGDRVAQLVLLPHFVGAVERMASIDDLPVTLRGEGGFGSTGAS